MSRVVAPLLSFSAAGAIAKTQVYASWKGRPYVRQYVTPANPNSSGQQETRNTFAFLNAVWRYMPADAVAAWAAYANGFQITDRNAFIKRNLSDLRSEADLTNFIFSPSANGGIVAAGMTVTPGDDQLTVALTAPSLPTGWTITQAIAAAVRQQDPQSGTLYPVFVDTDDAAPWECVITGLASAQTYVVGGWFRFTKPDGSLAYGEALMDTGLTT